MSGTIDTHLRRDEPDVIKMPAPVDWIGWLKSQGVFAVMLIAAATWFGWYIVIPMRDDQRAFMQSVIKTNEANAATQQANATTLSGILETQKQMLQVQQQLRDDTRRGAWNHPKGSECCGTPSAKHLPNMPRRFPN